MKVIFDFDDVIFNTKAFKGVIFQILEKQGYANLSDLYRVFRKEGKPFSLYEFIKTVDSSLDDTSCELIYQRIIGFCEHCVNHEVLDVMKKLGRDTCYILTSGDEQFQKDKIERSIGYDTASEIVVVPGGKRNEIVRFCKKHPHEDILFVDDKQFFLDEVSKEECSNLKTVLFDEQGVEKLQIEISNAKHDELSRFRPQDEKPSFGMRLV